MSILFYDLGTHASLNEGFVIFSLIEVIRFGPADHKDEGIDRCTSPHSRAHTRAL